MNSYWTFTVTGIWTVTQFSQCSHCTTILDLKPSHQYVMGTLNSEMSMQVYQRDSRNLRSVPINNLIHFKKKKPVATSATPKGLEEHRRLLKWMIAEFLH